MLKFDERQTTEENLSNLGDYYEGIVRGLEDRRNRIATGPNAPELRSNDIAAIDALLAPARYHAHAARDGAVFHDPRDPADCTAEKQRWVAWARTLGRLVNPGNYGESVHDADADQPIKVIRGGNGSFDMSSPTMSTR